MLSQFFVLSKTKISVQEKKEHTHAFQLLKFHRGKTGKGWIVDVGGDDRDEKKVVSTHRR